MSRTNDFQSYMAYQREVLKRASQFYRITILKAIHIFAGRFESKHWAGPCERTRDMDRPQAFHPPSRIEMAELILLQYDREARDDLEGIIAGDGGPSITQIGKRMLEDYEYPPKLRGDFLHDLESGALAHELDEYFGSDDAERGAVPPTGVDAGETQNQTEARAMTEQTLEISGMQVSGDGETYTVKSTSGKTYTVLYKGSGDGDPDYISLWECDCPAYKFGRGKVCKHIEAVSDYGDELYENA